MKKIWREFSRTAWGLLTVELLAFQAGTGILLALSYRPGLAEGYQSTLALMREAPMGFFLRGFHHYTSYALVGTAFLHLVSVYFRRSYQNQVLAGWLVGNFFFLALVLSTFTGLLLPLDLRSGCATRVALSLLASLPLGLPLARLLFGYSGGGDFDPHSFHVLHIAVLPLVMVLLLWFHRLRQGELSRPGGGGRVALLAGSLALILLVLSGWLPPGLGEAFDPVREIRGQVYPAWMFMSVYLLVSYTSRPGGWLVLLLILLALWLLLPALEKRLSPGWAPRLLWGWGVMMMAVVVLATALAYPLTSLK